MKDAPIVISMSVVSKVDKQPIGFEVHDEGIKFHGNYNHEDLIISYAVLMDLADAIKLKIESSYQ